MTAHEVGPRTARLGLTIALGLAMFLAGSGQAFADNDCPSSGNHCNVEATNNPLISWPRGIRSTFVNATGTQAGIGRVGSIILFNPNILGDQVEYGWFWANGRNRAQILRVTVFNSVYNEVDLANIVGIATYTYEIRWFPAQGQQAPANFLFTTYDSSGAVVSGSQYEQDNPPFSTGYPSTNGERHSITDTWTTTLVFNNLLKLSSSPSWSSWDAAMCFFDNDPTYQNYTHPGPYVEVKAGGANC